MDELNDAKIQIKHAIRYLNNPKIDRSKLPLPHRISLESRIETLTDVLLMLNGNKDIKLTNLFWNL